MISTMRTFTEQSFLSIYVQDRFHSVEYCLFHGSTIYLNRSLESHTMLKCSDMDPKSFCDNNHT